MFDEIADMPGEIYDVSDDDLEEMAKVFDFADVTDFNSFDAHNF